MTANARLIPIVAVLLVALGGTGFRADSARTEENCLAAPNRQAPQGSHWYYHLDRVKQSKCWYLRSEGPAIQKPAAQEQLETTDAKNSPAATPKIAPAQLPPRAQQQPRPVEAASPTLGARLTQENEQNPARQAAVDTVAWPDPPSPARASTAWPNPPSDLPPTAATLDESELKVDRADALVAEPGNMEASQRVMPTSIIVAGAIGLAIAGIVLRLIARMALARRRTIYADRRKPDWIDRVTSERRMPELTARTLNLAPGRADENRLDDEVKQTLRMFARVLDGESDLSSGGDTPAAREACKPASLISVE